MSHIIMNPLRNLTISSNGGIWLVLLLSSIVTSCPGTYTSANEGIPVIEPDMIADGVGNDSMNRETIPSDDGGIDAAIEDLRDEERLGQLVEFDTGPMAGFFDSLYDMYNTQEGLVRVLHYGDSHTAADFLTTAIRRPLQKKLGDGGRGFILLGRPWRTYQPKDVETSAGGSWKTERILIAADPVNLDGRYGLGGVSVKAALPSATATFSTTQATGWGRKVSFVDFFFLRQPQGGSFRIFVDGKRAETVKTASKKIGSGFHRLILEEGHHEIQIRLTGDGEVRLFGAAMENDGPGLVYDTLGINGAFFYTPLRWDATLLATQVKRRDPQLIVTAYGANEADSRRFTPKRYAREVKRTMDRLLAGAPDADCLMLGPLDRRMPYATPGQPNQLDAIIDVQQSVADEIGCAFLNTREMMGGPDSFELWLQQGLAQPDGIHLTVRGYLQLGETIAAQIMDAYEKHLAETLEPGLSMRDASADELSADNAS
jgi:lysophospholipase L1-like esterase